MDQFVNILTQYRSSSDILWVSRYIRFTKAFITTDQKPLTHNQVKKAVLDAETTSAIEELFQETEANPTDKARVRAEIREILNEIGYSKSMATIRWLSLILVKVIHKTLDGIYVNESRLLKLKASMGDCPVVFVPTHRSYGDFILMAFVCFVYEIEIPCVAAGIDFLSMWAMGEILRKTKAFYIRRTFQDDKLYKFIFRQYVSTLLSKGDSPVEFFIEGTRSRTGKSLTPKYGFLSMVLQPFLKGDVPDIKLVPVSICYDRFLEDVLYSRELLGTPKPKETTKGLLKVFSILNQNYGNVYFNFGEPISVHDWISRDCTSPLTRRIPHDVQHLASLIIQSHTKLQVLGAFNLVMVALYNHFITYNLSEMPLSLVFCKLKLLLSVMHALGVNVLLTKGDLHEEVAYACTIHPELIAVKSGKLHLLGGQNGNQGDKKLQASGLATVLTPNQSVLLLLYVNPMTMELFCPSLLMALTASNHSCLKTKSALKDDYFFLCDLYQLEFPFGCCDKDNNYQNSEKFLINMKCICSCEGEIKYETSTNFEVIQMLNSLIRPYILGYSLVCQYLLQVTEATSTKQLIYECQMHLNSKNPCDSLSLALATMNSFIKSCLSVLIKMECMRKQNKNKAGELYSVDHGKVAHILSLLSPLEVSTASDSALKNKL